MGDAASVDDYIAAAPEPVQPMLRQLRQAIREAAPSADERISYGMSYYHLNGRLAYFKAHSRHVGLYPFSAVEAGADGLEKHVAARSTLQFPLDQPLPLTAIATLIRRRVESGTSRLGP